MFHLFPLENSIYSVALIKFPVFSVFIFFFLLLGFHFLDFQKEMSTQVFILCDKPKDASLILISFRGTEPFDADDWSTDFDYSWYEIPKVGKVHMGFLEALGLGNRTNAETFQYHLQLKGANFSLSESDDVTGNSSKGSETIPSRTDFGIEHNGSDHSFDSKELASTVIPPEALEVTAYYAVKKKLKSLLKDHKNAKFVVTGHSSGGALATLFPMALLLHEETEVLQRLLGLYTFGQPRVGNQQLVSFMEAHLETPTPKYFRVVYCNDWVPRLPNDDKTFSYKHFGVCLYYDSFYVEHVRILTKFILPFHLQDFSFHIFRLLFNFSW